jgi:hypothetical protein
MEQPVLPRICKDGISDALLLTFPKAFLLELVGEEFDYVNMHNNNRNPHMFIVWTIHCIILLVEWGEHLFDKAYWNFPQ